MKIQNILFFFYIIPLSAFEFTQLIPSFLRPAHEEIINTEYPIKNKTEIEIIGISGSLTIKGWNHPQLALHATKKGSPDQLTATDVHVVVVPEKITIKTTYKNDIAADIDYVLMVPYQANITEASLKRGSIKIKDIQGTVNAITHEGDITLKRITNSITARITNTGTLTATIAQLPSHASLFLETFKGSIILYAPDTLNAYINAHTAKGILTSELRITIAPQTVVLNSETYARWQKEVCGTIGEGGAHLTIDATQGDIQLLQ